jgi:hypothetical protein
MVIHLLLKPSLVNTSSRKAQSTVSIVKCFGDVELQQDDIPLHRMNLPSRAMHQLEVVMKAATTDEHAQLRPTMNQSNRPKILNLNRVGMLWQEGNQGLVGRM